MKYMGSKRRIAKEILPIILKDRKENQWYVEPFVGGANMIDKVTGNRIGSDVNPYLIALLKYIQIDSFSLPDITEEKYKHIQTYKELYPEWLVGYVGFCLSFGAKFFGGYGRDKAGKRDYQKEAKLNLKKQSENIKGIHFYNVNYTDVEIPPESIIYCDPPYQGTTKYKNGIDHNIFWQWCRGKIREGHSVFVSEYTAPDDFKCIWQKEVCNSLTQDTGSKKGIEKLFTGDINGD